MFSGLNGTFISESDTNTVEFDIDGYYTGYNINNASIYCQSGHSCQSAY